MSKSKDRYSYICYIDNISALVLAKLFSRTTSQHVWITLTNKCWNRVVHNLPWDTFSIAMLRSFDIAFLNISMSCPSAFVTSTEQFVQVVMEKPRSLVVMGQASLSRGGSSTCLRNFYLQVALLHKQHMKNKLLTKKKKKVSIIGINKFACVHQHVCVYIKTKSIVAQNANA